MPYIGNYDFQISARFGSGSRLSATELAPRRLLFGIFLIPYIGNQDFQMSVIFGSWLTPFGPGISAWALTFFVKLLMPFAGIAISRFRRDLGSSLTPFGPGVSA